MFIDIISNLRLNPHKVNSAKEQSGLKPIIAETQEQWGNTYDCFLENGWKMQFTWLELVRGLDEIVSGRTENYSLSTRTLFKESKCNSYPAIVQS